MKLSHIYLYIIALLTTIAGVTSCDKLDDNGPFEGYWLLMDYDGYDGNRVEDLSTETLVTEGGYLINDLGAQTKEVITWSVRNQLIQIRNQTRNWQYHCRFSRTAHELTLIDAYFNDGSNDTKVEFTEMAENLCIPADGKFEVISLTRKAMVLKAGTVTITFKKN